MLALKKTFYLIFLFAYLVSATELHQLMKLPSLLEHFAEHQGLKRQITFSQFLYQHYMLNDDGDNDQQEETKLPFKSHDHCISMGAAFFVVPAFTLALKPPVAEVKTYNIYSSLFLTYSCPAAIWQPPKRC